MINDITRRWSYRTRRTTFLRVIRSIPKVPAVIILVATAAAVLSGVIVGPVLPDASKIDFGVQYAPPWPLDGSSLAHPLGTDRLGRDVLSRLIEGARTSLALAAIVILAGGLVGTVMGLVAGNMGGLLDAAVMRVADVMLSFPAILLALVFVASIGPSFGTVATVLAVFLVPQFARVVRAEVLSLKERGFVVWARISGTPTHSIIVNHLLANTLNSIVVLATLQIGLVILGEAGLSFLGAGIPRSTATWGNMLADGRDVIGQAWWLTVIPGLAITAVVLSFNLLGDWLRDTLDPQLRQLPR